MDILTWNTATVLLLVHWASVSIGSEVPQAQKESFPILVPAMPDKMEPFLQDLRMNPEKSKLLQALKLSDLCQAHLIGWSEHLDTFWSLQMFDAMSKVPGGFLSGHTSSYGDFDECLAIRAAFNTNGAPDGFKGQYCTGLILPDTSCSLSSGIESRIGQTKQTILGPVFEQRIFPGIAVCMPSGCSKDEINILMRAAIQATGTTSVCVRVNHCQTDDKKSLRPGDIVMILVLTFISLLCVTGTSLDITTTNLGNKPQSKVGQVLLAFSLYTNTRKLLSTRAGGDNLGCIHGIRFLSTCWVVLAHTWATWRSKVWNTADLVRTYEDWTIYPILNGTLSVDTFFTMAGLLAAYNLLKELDKTKGRLNVPLLYLHRYLRLTPTYAILLGIIATLYEYLKAGPHTYEVANFASSCRAHWWHNLLYVNNLVRYNMTDLSNTICHGESWYLGNDMQFFLLSPILLWPLWRWRTVGKVLMGVVTVVSVGIPFTVTYVMKLDATLIPTALDRFEEFFIYSYTKPWMRFGPYVAGLWAGYVLYTVRKMATIPKLPRWVVICGWLTSTVVALLIMFGVRPFFDPTAEYRRLASAFYAGFHRFAWGLVVSWVILACTMGYGGPINKFLSWKAFVPLGRLSFCVYLISHLLQSLYYLSARQAISYDLYTGINHFFSHMVISLLVSFVACIAFESPFIALEKIFFRKGKPAAGTSRNDISPKNGEIDKNKNAANAKV